jgi:serine protease Do
VEIDQVAPGSPAANAGLRSGQLLIGVGKRPVYNPLDFQARMIDARVGEPLEIAISDGGRERTLRVLPQPLPSLAAERVRALSDHFELISVTPAIRSERHIVSQRGALIAGLSQQAQRIGLRVGDVIVEINRAPVRSAEEAAQVMSELFNRVQIRLTIERQGSYELIFI